MEKNTTVSTHIPLYRPEKQNRLVFFSTRQLISVCKYSLANNLMDSEFVHKSINFSIKNKKKFNPYLAESFP